MNDPTYHNYYAHPSAKTALALYLLTSEEDITEVRKYHFEFSYKGKTYRVMTKTQINYLLEKLAEDYIKSQITIPSEFDQFFDMETAVGETISNGTVSLENAKINFTDKPVIVFNNGVEWHYYISPVLNDNSE